MSSSKIDPTIVQVTTPAGAGMLAVSIPISEPSVVTLRVRAALDPDSKVFRKIISIDFVGGVLTLIGVEDDFPPISTPGALLWTVTAALGILLLDITVTASAGVEVSIGWDISTLP